MTLTAAVGRSQNLDGRLAGSQAARDALDRLGGNPVRFALVTASHQPNISSVLSGVTAMLGSTPLLGLSVHSDVGASDQQSRTVQVGLLAGEGLQARADFWMGFDSDSSGTARRMVADLGLDQEQDGLLLLAAEGFAGDADLLGKVIGKGNFSIAGALAASVPVMGASFQIGGSQAGKGGVAAAWLNPTGETQLAVGMGLAHGWSSVGAVYEVTNVGERSVHTLDHRPTVEVYANSFGNNQQDWTSPPLNKLVRLYPLGVETGPDKNLVLHAPLLFKSDGSLRIQSRLQTGSLVHLMLGSYEACLVAAQRAATEALESLHNARPVIAIVFADLSWQQLFESHPDRLTEALRAVLGEEIPFIGGYTMGQMANSPLAEQLTVHYQQIMVLVIGEGKSA